MKKLLLMTFAILTVSAFAAEENKEATQNQIEKTRNIASQQAVQNSEMSLSESFMTAFGMTTKTAEIPEEGLSHETAVASTTAAINAAVVNANNGTTIVTPYGKY